MKSALRANIQSMSAAAINDGHALAACRRYRDWIAIGRALLLKAPVRRMLERDIGDLHD